MSSILFLIKELNTYGLYKSFATQLHRQGHKVQFLDVSLILNAVPNDQNQLAIEEDGFHFQIYQNDEDLDLLDQNQKFCVCAEDILNKYIPTLVVVPYEFHFYFYFIQLARQKNIFSLHIQHGLWGPGKFLPHYNRSEVKKTKKQNIFKKFIRKIKSKIAIKNSNEHRSKYFDLISRYKCTIREGLHFPLNSNFISVPSEYYKQIVLKEVPHYKPNQILVVGHQRFDTFDLGNESLNNAFQIDPTSKVVSYFFSPFHLYPDRFIEKYNSDKALIEFMLACLDTFKDMKIHFLILLHPTAINYKNALEAKIQSSKITNYTITHSNNKQGLIYKESFLIGGAKTGALSEASFFNSCVFRQIYVLDGLQEPFQIDFQLVQTISHPSHNKLILGQNSTLKTPQQNYLLGPNDGKAGERLYKELLKIGVIT